MQHIDADLCADARMSVRADEITPAYDSQKGDVKVYVTTGFGIALESVDELVPAVQDCIEKKHEHGQGAAWLVVALDGTRASRQLEEAFDRETDSSAEGAQDLSALDLRGFE